MKYRVENDIHDHVNYNFMSAMIAAGGLQFGASALGQTLFQKM